MTTAQAERFAHQVLQLKTSEEIRTYLTARLHEISAPLRSLRFCMIPSVALSLLARSGKTASPRESTGPRTTLLPTRPCLATPRGRLGSKCVRTQGLRVRAEDFSGKIPRIENLISRISQTPGIASSARIFEFAGILNLAATYVSSSGWGFTALALLIALDPIISPGASGNDPMRRGSAVYREAGTDRWRNV